MLPVLGVLLPFLVLNVRCELLQQSPKHVGGLLGAIVALKSCLCRPLCRLSAVRGVDSSPQLAAHEPSCTTGDPLMPLGLFHGHRWTSM